MPALTMTATDVDEARSILQTHFYSNSVDVLQPQPGWQARFVVAPAEVVTIGDIEFGTDVKVKFGELGAYHVDVALSGQLAWRQGAGAPRLATPGTAAVFQPVGDTTLERWSADCRLLAVKIDRSVLEAELARLLDAPV